VNVGEMQRKLSLWAEREKSHKFFDLYHLLYDKDWMQTGWTISKPYASLVIE
jgi:hypothetical protein